MKYPVTLIKSEEGYAVNCPTLPGCWSQGTSQVEALANISEAIRLWLEVAWEDENRDHGQDQNIEVIHTTVDVEPALLPAHA